MPLLRNEEELIGELDIELAYNYLKNIYFDPDCKGDMIRDKLTATKSGCVYDGSLMIQGNTQSLNSPIKLYEVKHNFYCSYNARLKDLEGAPEVVGGNFECKLCFNLKSLKGVPKKVGGNFKCIFCSELESTEGAPEVVGGNFECHWCHKPNSTKNS